MSNELDKIQVLFVRACKTSSADYRLKRLYKAFYFGGYEKIEDFKNYSHLARILMDICKSQNLIDPEKLVEELDPNHCWKYNYGVDSEGEYNYWRHVMWVLIDRIRHSPTNLFEGYIQPAYWRNK